MGIPRLWSVFNYATSTLSVARGGTRLLKSTPQRVNETQQIWALHLRRCLHNAASRKRVGELGSECAELYPRVKFPRSSIACQDFIDKFKDLKVGEEPEPAESWFLHGRVVAIRRAGSYLAFVDIIQDGYKVQTLCNQKRLEGEETQTLAFTNLFQRLRRGDSIRVRGLPHRTPAGELSLLLTRLPEIVSPCLADLPTELEDPATRMRLRHVDMLVNPRTAALLRLRSEVVTYVRQFLLADGHMEVQTPILAENAGGATARAFVTSATEFSDRKITLRIAPELWLKRLIIGGFDKVFEIGPSFRNEGIDLTHNPEFTMCEFYKAFAGLSDLMRMTEDMLSGLSSRLVDMQSGPLKSLALPDIDFRGPYGRIDFIEQLEALMGRQFPDLRDANAEAAVAALLGDFDVEMPESPSLPQMLDRLSAHFLEPHCKEPTYIVHHPECLAPLAKSFKHPTTGQMVSARAELFINGQEIVNTYEEENSPIEQRRKLEEQLRYKRSSENAQVDEGFLEALEWGLPPTGGWGGGIERMCMALSGTNRINDLLSFGTLRNVVALGRSREHP